MTLITTLTVPEVAELLNKVLYDEDLTDRKSPAGQFCIAWLDRVDDSVNSMIWALNNEALPYRHVLIAHLVSTHLHDTP